MAKKNRTPRSESLGSSRKGNISSLERRQGYSEHEIREILKDFISSPAVKYVAAGITTALLTRLANRINDRYPEVSTFIRDNMHTLEGKLEEFRNSMQSGYSQHH
jgi:hypothetical protein